MTKNLGLLSGPPYTFEMCGRKCNSTTDTIQMQQLLAADVRSVLTTVGLLVVTEVKTYDTSDTKDLTFAQKTDELPAKCTVRN